MFADGRRSLLRWVLPVAFAVLAGGCGGHASDGPRSAGRTGNRLTHRAGPVVGVGAGGYSGYALLADGHVWAWGDDLEGQIGPGGHASLSTTPVEVPGVTEVVMVAGGANTAYALQRGGAVWAWGDDSVDELGDTGAPSRARAVRIRLPGGIVSIAAGMLSAYALRRDGTVWAWGENSAGQRGRSVPQVASGTPRPISGLSDVVAIAAGAGDGYALRRDGTVWAWGDDSRGQLGVSACKDVRPSAPARSDCPAVGVPVRVQGLDTVKAIAAGANTAYALRRDRTVAAWGDNSFGTLGPSAHVSFSARAVTVARLRGVTAIGAGSDTAYAIMRDGRVRAWGKGVDGELGNGGFANRATPVRVREITGAVEVIGGGAMAYARDRNGRLWAWGSGTYGQLGNGRRISVPSPTRVLMSDLAALL